MVNNDSNELARKLGCFYSLLIQWVRLHQMGKSIEGYMKHHGYKKVAIYGLKELALLVYEELKGSSVEVLYGIDKNPQNVCLDIDTITPDEDLPAVDAVIVTAVYYYDEIKRELSEKVSCPIISLEDIVFEMEWITD